MAIHDGDPFALESYTVRTKVFKFLGAAFHVYDDQDNVVGYSKQKAFKLKEDIRLYRSEDMAQELLVIKARTVIDFGATYDVYDAQPTSPGPDPSADALQYATPGDERLVKVGSLRRKGLKSLVRDEWSVLGPDGAEVAVIREQGSVMALLRRFVEFVALLFPQKYEVQVGGATVGTMGQNFNLFVKKLFVTLPAVGGRPPLDRRLGMAAALLLLAIEGRQS